MNKQLRGSLLLLLTTIIWGSAFVAQSVGVDLIGPFTFQAARCWLALIVLIPTIAILDRRKTDGKTFWRRWQDKKLWKAGILCGIPLFMACNMQQVGLVDTDAGKTAFLTAMYIVIVPIIGFFRKEKPSKMIPVSILLAVAGLYCLSCVGVTRVSTSDLILIGCALMFAIQITFVDMFVKDVDPLRLNTIQVLICAILSAIVAATTEQVLWSAVLDCWLPIGYAGILSMGVAYSLQIVGQKDLTPSLASLIMSLESVVAVICGWLILGEQLTVWEAAGCIMVFASVILSQLPIGNSQK